MRTSKVSGQFYPLQKSELELKLEEFERKKQGQKTLEQLADKKVFAVIAPHAGYKYSGATAMQAFKALSQSSFSFPQTSRTFALFAPNHYGLGASVSLSLEDWQTPFGIVKTDAKFCREFLSASQYLQVSEEAHQRDHAIEVQLPFIQHFFPQACIAAVSMAFSENSLEIANDLASAVCETEKKLEKRSPVIASSDFTHYDERQAAHEKDEEAISAICRLDSKKFFSLVTQKNLSICGASPILVAMAYAKKKGAKEGVLLDFSDSGDETGEKSVVDYAAIAFA